MLKLHFIKYSAYTDTLYNCTVSGEQRFNSLQNDTLLLSRFNAFSVDNLNMVKIMYINF